MQKILQFILLLKQWRNLAPNVRVKKGGIEALGQGQNCSTWSCRSGDMLLPQVNRETGRQIPCRSLSPETTAEAQQKHQLRPCQKRSPLLSQNARCLSTRIYVLGHCHYYKLFFTKNSIVKKTSFSLYNTLQIQSKLFTQFVIYL